MRFVLALLLSSFLAGCASITVTALTPEGQKVKDSEEGLVFYRPKPYILVAKLPSTPVKDTKTPDVAATPQGTENAAPATKKKGPPSPAASTDQSSGSGDGKTDPKTQDPATPAPTVTGETTTSFSVTANGYIFKLIYLPDYSKPYAIKASSGMFGTATLKPTLQDGWMLTSLDGNSENKVPETLTAVASIVSSALSGGGGAAKAASTGSGKATSLWEGDISQQPAAPVENNILAAGLYEFTYTQNQISGIKMIGRFCDKGIADGSADCPAK